MATRLRITDQDETVSFFTLISKISKIGSGANSHVCIPADDVPETACLVEFDNKTQCCRIHSRCSEFLHLDNQPLDNGLTVAWQQDMTLFLGNLIAITLEEYESGDITVPARMNVATQVPSRGKIEYDTGKIGTILSREPSTGTPTKPSMWKLPSSLVVFCLAMSIVMAAGIIFIQFQVNQTRILGDSERYTSLVEELVNNGYHQEGENKEIFSLLTFAHFTEKNSRENARKQYLHLKHILDTKENSSYLDEKIKSYVSLRMNSL